MRWIGSTRGPSTGSGRSGAGHRDLLLAVHEGDAVVEAYAALDGEGPGLPFARAYGYRPALEDRVKVVGLVDTEPSWDALEAEVAPRASGYHLVEWTDRVPEEHIEGCCRIIAAFLDHAPHRGFQSGTLVPPDLRGRGYGTAMLDHVLDVARAHGRAPVVASVPAPIDGPADGDGCADRDRAAPRGIEREAEPVGSL